MSNVFELKLKRKIRVRNDYQIYDSDNLLFFEVNDTAYEILLFLYKYGIKDCDKIAKHLTTIYDVSEEQLKKDITIFINTLLDLDIIDKEIFKRIIKK